MWFFLQIKMDKMEEKQKALSDGSVKQTLFWLICSSSLSESQAIGWNRCEDSSLMLYSSSRQPSTASATYTEQHHINKGTVTTLNRIDTWWYLLGKFAILLDRTTSCSASPELWLRQITWSHGFVVQGFNMWCFTEMQNRQNEGERQTKTDTHRQWPR